MPVGKVYYDCATGIFLINDVLKAQNQAITKILHGFIMKILDIKERGLSSPLQRGGRNFS